jgi:hypothetical protein
MAGTFVRQPFPFPQILSRPERTLSGAEGERSGGPCFFRQLLINNASRQDEPFSSGLYYFCVF